MKLSILLVVLGISTTLGNAFAQNKRAHVKISEQVPDIEFKLLNHFPPVAKLSDYRGKVVILDFWATSCGPCIAKFPHLDSLQKENEDILKIITIGRDNLRENPNKLSDFLKRYLRKHQEFKLPIAFNDTAALACFPHRQISHFVWIDKNGKLLATTNGNEISTETIRRAYQGEPVDFVMKNDLLSFDRTLPLFADEDNGGKERNVKYKSLITGYISGLSGSQYTDQDKKGMASKMYFRDVSLLRLFRLAHQWFLPESQVVLNVKDQTKLVPDPSDKNWQRNNMYSYELMTAPAKMEKLRNLMQHDLSAYFGMTAKVEKRKVKCFEIVSLEQKNKAKKKQISEDDGRSIASIVQTLNSRGKVPVFDMSGYGNDRIIIEISEQDVLNLKVLKKVLNDQGFDIVETEKELDMFVITEVDE